ncbi:hypothetical protein RLEG12_26970 [Rhizobium leguminosarum bv. trifolii CB782]|nr:hypothetical protein RLEG12_26970 [Rhizobium leguminosarum bv. trifolii CB782]
MLQIPSRRASGRGLALAEKRHPPFGGMGEASMITTVS